MTNAADQIPMAQPVIGAREEELVLEVLRSGQLSLGRKTLEFEAGLAARVGVRFGRATSSGTAGLHLALRAVGVGEGDEVITSPLSFIASANSVLFERGRAAFVDIDPVTLNMDPAAVADAIGPKTKAILPVHIFGYPADTPRWSSTACRSSRMPAKPSARRTPTACPSAAAATRRCSRSTPTSSSRPARAAWSSRTTRRSPNGSAPSATRAARPTWAGSTTIASGSTTG